MQDSRARNARNGFEGAIIEKISDFFPKITEVSGEGFRFKILGRGTHEMALKAPL